MSGISFTEFMVLPYSRRERFLELCSELNKANKKELDKVKTK